MKWGNLLSILRDGANPVAPPAAPAPRPAASNDNAAILADTATKLTEPAEGTILHPYQDPGSVWTIGTGSTFDLAGNPVTASTPPITQAQALTLLERELGSSLQTVQNDCPLPMTPDEEAALTDLVFNIGAGNYAASSVLKCLRACDYDGACTHIADWNEQSGVVLAGLVNRRAAEQAEFKTMG